MVKKTKSKQKARGGRGNQNSVGKFGTPPPDPPVIKEVKWRRTLLKFDTVAATDAGQIEIVSAAKLLVQLTAQQRVPPPLANEKMVFRVHYVMTYGLPGIGDGGNQVYPSAKIRAYSLNDPKQILTSWAQDEAEDSGTLDVPARLSYTYPVWQQQSVILSSSTDALFVFEYYHTARGKNYVSLSYAYAEE